jgi:hypothetical protein
MIIEPLINVLFVPLKHEKTAPILIEAFINPHFKTDNVKTICSIHMREDRFFYFDKDGERHTIAIDEEARDQV